MTTEPRQLLRVEDLGVNGELDGRRMTLLRSISLSVAAGETVGIVGESGSGKSLTARAITGLLPTGLRASGLVEYGGRNLLDLRERELAGLRGLEIGLIFQDPFTMLNPLRQCGRQITEVLRHSSGRRLSRKERHTEAVRRLAEVGIEDPAVAASYPFQLSGGMRQRVGIAAALARDPRLLIADEPSTALDVTTQREILALLKSLQRRREMGMIMITHDLRVAFGVCDRIYVLYAGSLLELAPAVAIDEEPRHPYTLGLLLSEPSAERRVAQLPSIAGSVPSADDVAGQCTFAPRCDWATDQCVAAVTPLRPVVAGSYTACIRTDEIRDEMRDRRRRARASAPVPARRPAGDALLRCADVGKVFDARGRRVEALAGLSITVGEGESVGLVGESGSGKTTLGRCIVGLETPTHGEIVLGGVPAADRSQLSAAQRHTLCRTAQIVFQDPYSSLNPVRLIGASLREALTLDSALSRRDVESRVHELLERVGLPEEYAGRKPVALSGGERQRVAIARALAVRPKLLVCDEPVSALDVSVQAQILNLFERVREEEGLAFLFITHDLAVARQMVDRAYVLHRGEVVEEGPVDQILDYPAQPYTRRLVDSIPRSGDWIATPG